MTATLTIETFPNEAAADYIRGKAVVDPKNFGNLPAQLKQRAFTVAGIEQMDALRRLRDAIAKLPEGASWDEAKRETKSNFEKDKTLASDSFKRAAVCWGIGRELYTAPSIHWKISWTAKTRLEDNYCGDKFVVTEIEYFDNREIKSVTILDKDSNVEVKYNSDGKMKFIKAPQKPEPKPEPEEEAEAPKVIRTKEKAKEEPKADTPAKPAEETRLPADTAEVVDDLPFARK